MPLELLSMGASTLGGFALKYMANAQKDRHQQFMNAMKATEMAQKVVDGVWVRRFIVLIMMLLLVFIVTAPAFLDINTILVDEGWLFTTTTEIDGIIYDNTIRLILISIIGFYFGGAAATR